MFIVMALSTRGDAGLGQSGLRPGTPIPATPKTFGAGATALVSPNKAPREKIVPRSCEVLLPSMSDLIPCLQSLPIPHPAIHQGRSITVLSYLVWAFLLTRCPPTTCSHPATLARIFLTPFHVANPALKTGPARGQRSTNPIPDAAELTTPTCPANLSRRSRLGVDGSF
jgi:hypothetical protein